VLSTFAAVSRSARSGSGSARARNTSSGGRNACGVPVRNRTTFSVASRPASPPLSSQASASHPGLRRR
jgi:hypothetical protein